MRTISLLSLVFLSLPGVLRAQPYVDGGDTRLRFAQTWIGASMEYVAGGWSAVPGDGGTVRGDLPARVTPRLVIGGLHFWGHADFYLSFPLPQIGGAAGDAAVSTTFSRGIETGARVYPWRVEYGRVVPFAGVSWNLEYYQQQRNPNDDRGDDADGPMIYRHRVPLQAGLTWLTRFGRFDAGGSWTAWNRVTYPISRTSSGTAQLPSLAAWLGYSLMFDATLANEPGLVSGAVDRDVAERAPRGELDAFDIAAGLSTAFTLGRSSHNTIDRPMLDDRAPSFPFPDLSIGYYSHALDAAANVSYRPITQIGSGYGVTQELDRTVLSIEAIKFIGDYNGFVPFVGLGFGREWLHVEEGDGGIRQLDVRSSQWAPHAIAGWDIRPTRMVPFILRTNIRYTPGLKQSVAPGRDVMFDQLEINFIQLVLYPGRIFG